ncbi:MAG: RNA polymerase sigma factor [Bacteroidota bacterium]
MSHFRKNYEQQSDEEIMLRLREKEREAFSVLYDRYAGEMVNFFYRRLGQDEAKAQDFLHDLFLKLLNDPEKYTPGKAFRPWLYSIALNMCKNEYRKLKVREDYRLSGFSDISGSFDGIDKIDTKLFEKELTTRLNLLDETHREVFLLRFQQELSIAEIAEMMGCPEGTVKSRLFYTLKALSMQLKVFNPLIN